MGKLVRDKIPSLIEQNGQKPLIRVLDRAEYCSCLEAKLDEEVAEFHADRNAEELADILEVVFALAESRGCSRVELTEIYLAKHEKRGGFRDRVFLVSVED